MNRGLTQMDADFLELTEARMAQLNKAISED
jgi:hypothetical protein